MTTEGDNGTERAAPDAQPATHIDPPAGLGGARVLLIDDNDLLLRAMARTLTMHGYDPVMQADPVLAAAWAAYCDDWDAILCDLRLPHLGGVELLEYVTATRRKRLAPPVPLVLITGSPHAAAEMDRALASGAYAVLPRLAAPFDAPGLLSVVRNAIEHAVEVQA